jgi:hypothetical protein
MDAEDPVRVRAREEITELRMSVEYWRERSGLPGGAGRAARRAYCNCLAALWRAEALAGPAA